MLMLERERERERESESVVSGFSRGQRSRRTNYRSWPSEGHVTVMEDSP